MQRFGNAITANGILNLRKATYSKDFGSIEEGCQCTCCRSPSEGGLGITRAFIYHITAKETTGAHLLTMHNVHYQLNLMRMVRESILQDRFPRFCKDFFGKLYKLQKERYPNWAVDALRSVGVDLMSE